MDIYETKNSNKGFTMIELIVSIFIIGIISGLFLTNYHSAGRRADLAVSVQKLASDIRLAQQNSLGFKEFNNELPQGGWGISLSKNSPSDYFIFADKNENKSFDLLDGEEYRKINLPAGVKINDISFAGSPASNSLDITFLPPDPITYINDTGTSATVTLIDANNSTKAVQINFLGLVDILN